jgi:hypothetical protein
MALTLPGVLLEGTHAGRPAASAVGKGSLYSCSDHSLVYQSDGSSWGTWLDASAATVADILDLPTAEMDDTLVLAPDGAGGVEFRAETGGGGGGLVLLASLTASASATLDFTTRNAAGQSGAIFQSDFDEYQIDGINLAPATNGVDLQCKVGTGGGPTYAGGTDYFSSMNGFGSSGGSVQYNAASTAQWTIARTLSNGANYGNASFSIRLAAPQDTASMKYYHGTIVYHDGTQVYPRVLGGLWALTTTLTAVRFLMSSGNIASGKIRIYGIAK